ncbi:MAG: uracil phosphoribosyltransferase [Prevotellaceae bacterium]|jgi:uracil phosphoribosyltransferase|nr:uracil phosphoribosyltransferase [Prevotellaceae bacterium]
MNIYNLSEHNSLLNNFLQEIRSVEIQQDSMRFRRNLERMGEVMAYEISKTMRFADELVTTPLGVSHVQTIADKVVLATIFRAGLPFHQGFLNYFDRAENAFVSAYRKYKDTLKFEVMVEYLAAPSIEGKTLIIIDPMLATGSSMELAYRAMLRNGTPAQVHIASVIGSRAGVAYVEEHLPENTCLWLGAIDPDLDSHSYIVPGLGDAGDLAFGDKM